MEQKIRQALEDGKAIKCKTEEEARKLFEVMGWGWENWVAEKPMYFWIDGDGDFGCHSTSPHGKYVEFSALTQPNIITAFHAVGVGDWLQDGVQFEFEDDIWHFYKGHLIKHSERDSDIRDLDAMFDHPEEIKPVQVWSEETKKDARAALRLGFDIVRKYDNAMLPDVQIGSTKTGDRTIIDREMFADVQPGQTVSLDEIVRG